MNNFKNTLCVFMAFSSILLDPLHNYVVEKLTKHFDKIYLGPRCAQLQSFSRTRGSLARTLPKLSKLLPCDPDKPTTKFEHPRGATTIQDLSEFARMYVGNIFANKNFCIDISKDVRVFLTIMVKAGCFNEKEAEVALKLKSAGNSLAHGHVFDLKGMEEVLKDIENLLIMIPGVQSRQSRRELKQIQKKGANFLKEMTEEQLTSLTKSLGDTDGINTSIKDSILTEITSTLNTFAATEKINALEVKNRKANWSKLPVIFNELQVTFLVVLLKNRFTSKNLHTISKDGEVKFNEHQAHGGENFKMEIAPFAKGTSRAAYMGHFVDGGVENGGIFYGSPSVVVKRSDVPAKEFLQIHAVAEVFAEKWNLEVTETQVEFLNLAMAELPWDGKMEIVTIEEYINRGKYTKW